MARVTVRVHPRAHEDRVVEVSEGQLEVWTRAPTVDGRANEAVCRAIADSLGLARTRVRLVAGGRSRMKIVQIGDS
ncbi:MAG: DUF167 domain-containing protein [Chloroflexi bacterium]|nr:DUF167 domain-containing protein [Chloroflexota bacterium]